MGWAGWRSDGISGSGSGSGLVFDRVLKRAELGELASGTAFAGSGWVCLSRRKAFR